MKTKKHLWILTIFMIIIAMANDAEAQFNKRNYPGAKMGFDIKQLFHSVDFNAGYYIPSMSYWNEESYLVNAGKEFNGGLMFQGGVELRVYEGVLVGLYAGTFSDKVKSYSIIGNIERFEDLVYRITPLSLQAKYQFGLGDPRKRYRNIGIAKLHPYLGAAVNYSLITQTIKREYTDPNRDNENLRNNGTTVSFSGLVGAKYDVSYYFGLGVEMNYYFGSFQQAVSVTGGEQSSEQVDITGPCFNGKLYIKIPHQRFYQRPKRR